MEDLPAGNDIVLPDEFEHLVLLDDIIPSLSNSSWPLAPELQSETALDSDVSYGIGDGDYQNLHPMSTTTTLVDPAVQLGYQGSPDPNQPFSPFPPDFTQEEVSDGVFERSGSVGLYEDSSQSMDQGGSDSSQDMHTHEVPLALGQAEVGAPVSRPVSRPRKKKASTKSKSEKSPKRIRVRTPEMKEKDRQRLREFRKKKKDANNLKDRKIQELEEKVASLEAYIKLLEGPANAQMQDEDPDGESPASD